MTEVKTFTFFFLDQLRRRKWAAMMVAWIVCITGWFVVSLMPDRYLSEARFHVDTTTLLTPLLKGISVDDQSRDSQVAIMQRTLTSRPNLLKVAQMTDLDKGVHSEEGLQDLVASLEKRITIRSQGPNLFDVQFVDNSPVAARNVIQALLTIFVESSVGDKRDDIKSARTFIDTQIEDYEVKLKAAEQRMADFKIQNVGYLSSNSQTYAARMESAQENAKAAQFEYDDAAAQSQHLRQELKATPQYLSLNAAPQVVLGNANTLGGTVTQRIMTLQGRLDELKLQYTDKHPDVVATRQALERLLDEQRREASGEIKADADLRGQVPNEIYSQLSLRLAEADGRVDTAKRKLNESQSIYESLKGRANEAPKIEAEFTNLNRDYEVLRASYDTLLQRRESARIAAAADSTAEPIQFRMVAAPELPARPEGPKRELLNIAVLIAGLLAAGGFVVLLAQIDDRVISVRDFALFPGTRTLGTVTTTMIEPWRLSFDPRRDHFGLAVSGLAVAFAVILLTHPNFSALTRAMM